MKKKLPAGRVGAAVLAAALAAWRLPDVVTMPSNPWVFWPLVVALFAAFAVVFLIAFALRDRRLAWVSYPIGFLFACFAVLGKPLSQNHVRQAFKYLSFAQYGRSGAAGAALQGPYQA